MGKAYCPKCKKELDTVVVVRGDMAEWNAEDQEYVDEEAQMWWQYRCPNCDSVVDGGQS